MHAIAFGHESGTVTLAGDDIRRGDYATTLDVRVVRRISQHYWECEPAHGRTAAGVPLIIRGRALNYCECEDMDCRATYMFH